MRRAVGVILVILGVALLAGAAVLRLVVAPSVIKAPVQEDGKPFRSTSVATGAGSLLNQQSGRALGDLPLRAEIRITADVPASTDDVAVWDVRTVVTNTTNNTELRRTTDRVAFDRITSEAVIGYDPPADDKYGLDRNGTIAYKFPFGAKKTTYEYFDTETGKGWPARYKGTTEIDGLRTYHYEQVIEPTVVDEALFPDLLSLGDLAFRRVYSNKREFFVEPRSGIIVRAEEEMKQALRLGRTELETPALTATLAFDNDTISYRLREARQARQAIDAVQETWPMTAGGTGLFFVLAGGLLARPRRKRAEPLEAAATQ